MNRRVQPGDLVELLPAAEQTVAIDEERQIRFAEGLLKSGTLEVVYEDDVMAATCRRRRTLDEGHIVS